MRKVKRQIPQESQFARMRTMPRAWRPLFTCASLMLCAVLLFTWVAARSTHAANPASAESPQQEPAATTFQLTSTAFDADGAIPPKYTCSGAEISPALAWTEPPAGTQSFALVVDDPDAPQKAVIHWLIYDLPPTTRALPEGVPTKARLPDGSRQGKNDHGKMGYSGPCPPPGAAHHYFFKLYALDYKTGLKPKASEADVERAIKDHVVAKSELIARFQR